MNDCIQRLVANQILKSSLETDEIDYAIMLLEEKLRQKRQDFLNDNYLPTQKDELVQEVNMIIKSIQRIKEKFDKQY